MGPRTGLIIITKGQFIAVSKHHAQKEYRGHGHKSTTTTGKGRLSHPSNFRLLPVKDLWYPLGRRLSGSGSGHKDKPHCLCQESHLSCSAHKIQASGVATTEILEVQLQIFVVYLSISMQMSG
jgi:hypothetical protein